MHYYHILHQNYLSSTRIEKVKTITYTKKINILYFMLHIHYNRTGITRKPPRILTMPSTT